MAQGAPWKGPVTGEGQVNHQAELTWEGSYIGEGKGLRDSEEVGSNASKGMDLLVR